MMSLLNVGSPSYKVKVGGSLASYNLKNRIISLSVVHNPGFNSDSLQMQFSDQGGAIQIPTKEQAVEVWLGYTSSLAPMGKFFINRRDLSGSSNGQVLSVSGTPSLLRDEKTKTWANVTLKNIIDSIASSNALKPRVSAKFQQYQIPIIQQYKQSDMEFILQLAERYNAMSKTMMDSLLFLEQGQAMTASGIHFTPLTVKPNDIISWRSQNSDQIKYDGVIVNYYDLSAAQQKQAVAGKADGKRVFRVSHTATTEQEAVVYANSKYRDLNRGNGTTLSLSLIGNQNITCEVKVKISGLRKGINGNWIVKTATHQLNGNGYQTDVTLYEDINQFTFSFE